jgi:hypothetical protein
MASCLLFYGTSEMTNERKNITQPDDWWQVFESEAARRGMTLSEFAGIAMARLLTKEQRATLSPRVKPGRKKHDESDY